MRARVTTGLYMASVMVACTGGGSRVSGVSGQAFEVTAGQDVFAGRGNSKLLEADELAIYHSDRKYLRSLMKRGVAMVINHADPRQHRFAIARMKLAGKTPDNSPELFRQMERMQSAHLAQGLAPGEMLPRVADDGSLQSQHAMLATGRAPTAGIVGSGAMASRMPALSYGYIDCNVYDGDGNALGDTSFKEVFGDLTYLVPRCEGDSSFAQVPSLEGDSFLTESLLDSDVTNQEYLLGDAVSDAVGDPTLGEPTIDHPQDLNKDGKIIACLDRQDSDCEYPGIGTLTLRLPLKGSIAISNANFDVNKIGQYQRGMESGSQIFVTLSPPTQGGCTLPQNAAAFSMKDFWNAVTYSNTQISWDLFTGDNWAIFSSGCRLVHDRVDLTMRLHLPFVTTSYSGFEDIEISSATAEAAPNYQLPYPVQITNSCLAEGTRISTAHGADLRIEDIRVGDVVANPFAASLTVADMSIGVERAPMVHVTDSRGHELLMTEKHPLYVSGRGMVPAVRLARGDEIKTVDGPARLVTISREAYSGKVYNLKLGNASETLALGADQTTMYANGILVGDSQIQTEHEFMELRAQVRRDALPARWRDDYSSSRDRFRALQPQP